MSTKTLRKRIALVAVSALGAGMLSLVAIPAANAAVVANDFEIVSTSKLLACSYDSVGAVESAYIPTTSPGIVISPKNAAAGETAYVRVTGPAIISAATAGDGGAITTVSQTEINITDIADAPADTVFTVKPTGATGTVTVTYAVTSTSALLDSITISVVASCAGNAVSKDDSYYTIVSAAQAAGGGAWTDTSVDTADKQYIANAGKGYALIRVYDQYGDNLATTGAVVAVSSSAACKVKLEAAGGALAAGTSQTSVLASVGDDVALIVSQATTGASGSCPVTVTMNGVSLGTKTFILQGAPSKITVSDITIGAAGGQGFYRVAVQDAAGNYLPGLNVTYSATNATNIEAANAGIVTNPQENSLAATSSTVGTGYGKTQSVSSANIAAWADETAGKMTAFTCSATKTGTAKITVRVPLGDGISYVTSDPFTVACGGALDTWSISLDKASYAPGEIATLTVSGKDALGNPVATTEAFAGYAGSFGGMTFISTPANGDTFSSGIGTKTYQLKVDTTEGAYVGSFKLTGTTDAVAKTLQYKIAATTASVTNAEVLAAIVKLIASINKQIAALQKALTKKK